MENKPRRLLNICFQDRIEAGLRPASVTLPGDVRCGADYRGNHASPGFTSTNTLDPTPWILIQHLGSNGVSEIQKTAIVLLVRDTVPNKCRWRKNPIKIGELLGSLATVTTWSYSSWILSPFELNSGVDSANWNEVIHLLEQTIASKIIISEVIQGISPMGQVVWIQSFFSVMLVTTSVSVFISFFYILNTFIS